MITHLQLHIADPSGHACALCAEPLPTRAGLPPYFPGQRVGKLATEHTGARTWPAGEAEQTPACTAPAATPQ